MNVLKQGWSRYQLILHRHPYKMQSFQAAALMGTGDFIAQTYIERKAVGSVDVVRVLRFSVIGVFVGPALHLWYSNLDRFIKASGAYAAVGKVLVDQTVAAPVILGSILSAATLLTGAGMVAVKAKLRQDYIPVLTANYKVWPLVQLCNFTLVPLQYRVLVVQTVALFWNTYLSRKANHPVSP